jgi:hypothetical protein
MKKWFILFTNLFLLSSCRKEEESSPSAFPEMESGNMVLVCSEGNFRWGNAEAGLLNLRSGKSEWRAFQAKNKRPLGDVLQSAAFWNGKLWLVVNNSGRLEAVNPSDFRAEESISGFTSPRFLLPVSAEKAYVSDLYANALWILKKGNSQPSGSIPMPGWTEEMLFSSGKAWVLCRSKPWVLGINPQTDRVEDTLMLPGNGTSMAKGPEGKIWVGFENQAGGAPGIMLLHPDSASADFILNTAQDLPAPDRLSSTGSGDTLFFLSSGLCRLSTGNRSLFRYELPTANWYGLGLDPVRRELWLSDVKDYQQSSRILRMDLQGNNIQEYQGGIISSRFYFW